MTTFLEYLFDGLSELIFAVGGVRLWIFVFLLVLTVFFIATSDYLAAGISGMIALTVASTWKKRIRTESEE